MILLNESLLVLKKAQSPQAYELK